MNDQEPIITGSVESKSPSFQMGGKGWVKRRIYYSAFYQWATEHFKDLAIGREKDVLKDSGTQKPCIDDEHRAYVISTILSSVRFLEAAINELCKDIAEGHEAYIEPIDGGSRKCIKEEWEKEKTENCKKPLERRTTLEKYQNVLAYCYKEEFSKEREPYQNTKIVIKLRDALTHYKPDYYEPNELHELAKKLRGKFRENPLMVGSDNAYFLDRFLGSPCATWAVDSTKSFADEFFKRLGVTPNYQRDES